MKLQANGGHCTCSKMVELLALLRALNNPHFNKRISMAAGLFD